jgi:hypothetical protein
LKKDKHLIRRKINQAIREGIMKPELKGVVVIFKEDRKSDTQMGKIIPILKTPPRQD